VGKIICNFYFEIDYFLATLRRPENSVNICLKFAILPLSGDLWAYVKNFKNVLVPDEFK